MFGLDLRMVVRGLVAALLSAGLLFGAAQAAQGTAVSSCDFFPPTELGSCSSTLECDQMCSHWWEPGTYFPICDNGCCTCLAS